MALKLSQLSALYLAFVLLMVAFIALAFGQWLISDTPTTQVLENRNILDVAGRQRTYSQEIAKWALQIRYTDTTENAKKTLQNTIPKFEQIVQEWTKTHTLLSNYTHNSSEVKKYYQQQLPHYQIIEQACQKIIVLFRVGHLTPKDIEQQTNNILENETYFLEFADQITQAYGENMQEESYLTRKEETFFLILTLGVVILGAALIWLYARKSIEKTIQKLETKNRKLLESEKEMLIQNFKLQKLYTELKESEEQLKETTEKLQTSEEELRQQAEELRVKNAKLLTHEYERDAFIQDLQNGENILAETLLKLRDSQAQLERLSLVAEKTTNAVIITNADGIVEWVNQGFTDISGYQTEEILGRKPGHLLQGRNTNRDTIKLIRKNLQEAQPIEADVLNYHKNGKPYWIHLSITPILNQRNKLTNFIAIESDVTERIEREKELKTINAKLATQEKVLARALNDQKELWKALNSSALISIGNREGNIIEANEMFCNVSQYTREELIGENHNIVGSDLHSEEFWAVMWGTVNAGKAWRGEVCNRKKSGELYWVDSVINPILNDKGEVYRYLSIRYVITQRKLLEEEIRITQELLEKQNKAMLDSMIYASRIQEAMLPHEDEYAQFMPEHFIFYKPRDVVSGDFYWISKKNHRLILVVADCTGHGIPGAMMSMIGNQLLHGLINMLGITTPEYLLYELHDGVRKTLRQDQTTNRDGMEVSLCVIDEKYQELEFAGARSHLVYIQEDQMHEIKGNKYPIGGHQKEMERIFDTSTVDISKPTLLYMFSDGYQDQFGGKYRRKFMSKNLKKLFFKIYQEPMQTQNEELQLVLADWQGKNRQVDDILVMGVKINFDNTPT